MSVLLIAISFISGIVFHILVEKYCEDSNESSFRTIVNSEPLLSKSLKKDNTPEEVIPVCDASDWTLDEIVLERGNGIILHILPN